MRRRRIRGVPQAGLSSGRSSRQHFLSRSGAGWARSEWPRCGRGVNHGEPQNTLLTQTSTHLAFGQASFFVVLHEGLDVLFLLDGPVLEGLSALTDEDEQQHCRHTHQRPFRLVSVEQEGKIVQLKWAWEAKCAGKICANMNRDVDINTAVRVATDTHTRKGGAQQRLPQSLLDRGHLRFSFWTGTHLPPRSHTP